MRVVERSPRAPLFGSNPDILVVDVKRAVQLLLRKSTWVSHIVGAVLAAGCLLAAISLVYSQYQQTNILHFGEYGLARHLDGTVYRPFAYRVFTDWLARIAIALHVPDIPLPFIDSIVATACQAQHATPAATCEQVKAYVVVATGSGFGFLLTTYVLARHFVGGIRWGVATVGLAAVIVHALLLQGFGQPYDFSVLFFSSIMFLLATQQRDLAFGLALVVACLVKESLALYVPVFALIAIGARPLFKVLRNLAVQTSVFVGIYGWERMRFSHNLGASMYHNFSGHLRYVSENSTMSGVLGLVILGILLLYRMPQKATALQRSMLVLPVMLVLYVVGGQPGEFRIAFDVFPIILLPIADTLRRMLAGADPVGVPASYPIGAAKFL